MYIVRGEEMWYPGYYTCVHVLLSLDHLYVMYLLYHSVYLVLTVVIGVTSLVTLSSAPVSSLER